MKKISNKKIEELNRIYLMLKTKKEEISAQEIANSIKWKLEDTIEILKNIFENPEKYKTFFYVLLNSNNKFFIR